MKWGEKNHNAAMRSAMLVIAIASLAGCVRAPVSSAPRDLIEAAFVVLGVGGQAVARVITGSAECPIVVSTNRPGFLLLDHSGPARGTWRIEARDRRGDP